MNYITDQCPVVYRLWLENCPGAAIVGPQEVSNKVKIKKIIKYIYIIYGYFVPIALKYFPRTSLCSERLCILIAIDTYIFANFNPNFGWIGQKQPILGGNRGTRGLLQFNIASLNFCLTRTF